MLKMRVHAFIWGGVTLVHFAPPFVVNWITPSPVPAQSTLTSSGDGARAVTEPSARSGRLNPSAYLPALAGISHSLPRVRSPLIGGQLWPPFTVFQTPAVA